MADEDWEVLSSFLPQDWREKAVESHALKGLRKDKSEGNLLRTLLIHLAGGHSLRETALRARQAELADMSDVALLKRLRKSKDWLAAMCVSLFQDRGVSVGNSADFEVRLVDGTDVKEPGKTGSLWRIHYSVRVPSLQCDFFKITAVEGKGAGESLQQFPVHEGDHLIADRGYGSASGIEHVSHAGGFVLVRISPHNLVIYEKNKERFAWEKRLGEIEESCRARSWPAWIEGPQRRRILGRVCAVRKTNEAIELAHKRLRRRASKNGQQLKPETLLYAKYVIVFTTFAESRFDATEVLRWYRLRWQIELVFKRFKQIAQLGHLPKYDDESAKAWLYGKIFTALITEKLICCARSISPWGCEFITPAHSQPMA
jgi:DDE family transposase